MKSEQHFNFSWNLMWICINILTLSFVHHISVQIFGIVTS